MKYIKNKIPIEERIVEAVQWTGTNILEIVEFVHSNSSHPISIARNGLIWFSDIDYPYGKGSYIVKLQNGLQILNEVHFENNFTVYDKGLR